MIAQYSVSDHDSPLNGYNPDKVKKHNEEHKR